MKKIKSIIGLLLLLIAVQNSFARNQNVFASNVFVENKGQFDGWVNTNAPVKFAINSSDKIFFTAQGLTIKLTGKEIDEEALEQMERKQGKKIEKKTGAYFVNMQWEGCNKNSVLASSEESEGYYTFGEKGFENIKAKGFRKLIYKELYPGIDAEYVIPEKGGIKYSLIIHPGADITKIKMKYSGDVGKIKISADGNILMATPAGEITDRAPLSFYKNNSEKINSSFEIKGNIVSFRLDSKAQNTNQSIIIDPWTTTPTSLTTNNAALTNNTEIKKKGNVSILK